MNWFLSWRCVILLYSSVESFEAVLEDVTVISFAFLDVEVALAE
jgi:hypothetical protein